MDEPNHFYWDKLYDVLRRDGGVFRRADNVFHQRLTAQCTLVSVVSEFEL
jgi:hypothetical protein